MQQIILLRIQLQDATTLIHINQYNSDKQNLEKKKLEMSITTVLNTTINEAENKIPNASNLVRTTVLNTKINEVENKIPNTSNY